MAMRTRTLGAGLATALAATVQVHGQNLVANPSFDYTGACPLGISNLSSADGWYKPTFATPDLFADCSITYGNGVPNNGQGWQQPLNGPTYAGMILYTTKRKYPNYREYVATQLTSPLQSGASYTVKFHVSLADQSQYAIANIGAFVGAWPAGTVATSGPLAVIPQVSNSSGVIKDKSGWTVIQGSFVASGGETHLIIGNFGADTQTTVYKVPGIQTEKLAYYYIEDVSLTQDPPPYTACPGNSFTPNDAILEAEACGADTNGGCNAAYGPPNTETLGCNSAFTGTFWWDGTDRDTDWWSFTLATPSIVSLSIDANVQVAAVIMDAACPTNFSTVAVGDCPALATTGCLPAGDYRIFVAPSFNEAPFACGAQPLKSFYVGHLFCEPCESGCCHPSGVGLIDPQCAALVCAVDQFCCDVFCDGICEALALELCGPCQNCVTPPSGLVGWWTLDDIGPMVADSAGPHDGIALPAVILGVPGKVDTCAQFDGGAAEIVVQHHPALDVGCGGFTIDAWVKPEDPGPAKGVIAEKWKDGAGWSLICDSTSNPQGALTFHFRTPGFTVAASSSPAVVPSDRWSHVAVSVTPENPTTGRNVNFFIDGVQVATVPLTPKGCMPSTGPMTIGKGDFGGNFGDAHWFGEIDELQIFDRDVSPAELHELWSAGRRGKCKQRCITPEVVAACVGSVAVDIPVTFCNDSPEEQTFLISATVDSGASGCVGPALGPFVLPFPNPLTIPARKCVTHMVTVGVPAGLSSGDDSCYRITMENVSTLKSVSCQGKVHRTFFWCLPVCCPPWGIAGGQAVQLGFAIQNQSDPAGALECQFVVGPSGGHQSAVPVMLDGGLPGEPAFTLLVAEPGESATLSVLVEFVHPAPLRTFDILVLADEDQNGVLEAIMSIPITSAVVRSCLGDLNGNNEVDATDLQMLLSAWGAAGAADLDASGNVDHNDLELMLALWGPCS